MWSNRIAHVITSIETHHEISRTLFRWYENRYSIYIFFFHKGLYIIDENSGRELICGLFKHFSLNIIYTTPFKRSD